MNIFITDDDMCTTQKLNLSRVQKWLIANGCSIVKSADDADRVICMTCNGWQLLEQNSYDRINALRESHHKTIVVGCVVDAHPVKVKEIFSGPVVTTRSKQALSFEGIEELFPTFKIGLSDIPAQSTFRRLEDYRDYNPKRKFVNIAEGCSFACSFCTHKPGLGPRRSRPLTEIMEQIQEAVEDNAEVVHLMGMETALWGIDFGSSYVELLDAVITAGGRFDIHIAQFQPHGLKLYGDDLASLMCHKRVTDIQIPIQSTSDRIMKMMNRKNHSVQIGPHLTKIRSKNPRATLRTDVIVGWPTETDDERTNSLDWAIEHFDEVAVYGIELSPDLPAWKFQEHALTPSQLDSVVKMSKDYIANRGVMAHSGQQDDSTMEQVELKRKELRDRKLKVR
ncbi:radical SAM protein [Alphaproteobacteria bacterium]|nr:radical SAM protein [Alphaproteobacteria bacterium]